ncbi:glycosyltransferase, partial [bacterium]|nr:glycosyltransferase [bacterium]
MALSVSVVVCAYTADRWDQMVASVESVLDQSMPPKDTILVIDHNPELLAAARSRFPAMHVIANDGQQGLSDARNTGVSASNGEVVAFLDDDATADPAWLERLTGAFDDPKVIAAGGKADPEWEMGKPSWFPEEFNWVVGCTYRGHRDAAGPVRNVIGCNMAFRREVIDTAGGFKASLGRVGTRPVGGEETELSIRAASAFPGSVVWFDPEALISHFVPASRRTWKYFRSRCIAEGESKALITSMVGSDRALASERSYTLRTLPAGVLAGLRDAVTRGESGGLGRALAIVAGLGFTTFGYLRARVLARGDGFADTDFEPAAVVHIDIADPLPDVVYAADGEHGRAVVWIRRHGAPIGAATVDIPATGLRADDLAAFIGGLPESAGTALPVARTVAEATEARISVIIATRNRPEMLDRCLESLLDSEYRRFDVVVVDNAPADDATRDLVEDRYGSDPRVQYVREGLAGLARAHNRGVVHARGEILAFTDDDVLVDRQWLRRIAGAFNDPRVGCVTGMIVPMALDTRAQWWLEGYAGFSKGFERRVFD